MSLIAAEYPTIDAVSLRKAGEELKLDPKVVKGVAIGMGIELTHLSRSLFMSRRDFRRLKRHVESRETDAVALATR